jgi:thymidylate synthase
VITFGNGPQFGTVDGIQRWAFERLLREGLPAAPRGMPTKEVLGQAFTLTNPRARIVRASARRWSLPLAIGEFCWHASASNDVEALAYYAPRWREFAADGRTVRGSCYGRRIFGRGQDGRNCWDMLLALLREDPETRRATIDLSGDDLLDPSAPDVSCTSSFQVFVRNGLVHAVVHMRSNDAVWGLPYDIFLFTMLQEMLARALRLDLGVYIHSAASLHLYERHLALAGRVLNDVPPAAAEMPVMEPLSDLPNFLMAERAIRLGEYPPTVMPYWAELAEVLNDFARARVGGNKAHGATSVYS